MTSINPDPQFDPNKTYPIITPVGIREMDGKKAQAYKDRLLGITRTNLCLEVTPARLEAEFDAWFTLNHPELSDGDPHEYHAMIHAKDWARKAWFEALKRKR